MGNFMCKIILIDSIPVGIKEGFNVNGTVTHILHKRYVKNVQHDTESIK